MKKNYESPCIKVVEVKIESDLLVQSWGTSGSSSGIIEGMPDDGDVWDPETAGKNANHNLWENEF